MYTLIRSACHGKIIPYDARMHHARPFSCSGMTLAAPPEMRELAGVEDMFLRLRKFACARVCASRAGL